MRKYSLAYLTSSTCTAAGALRLAARTGYEFVGLRPLANTPGGQVQTLIDAPAELAEVLAVLRDSAVQILDLEIIRIGPDFQLDDYSALFDLGAKLGAKAILVAGDDTDRTRLSDAYARLCEAMAPIEMTADLEFMPWTGVSDANAALDVVCRAGSPGNAGILIDALHVDRSNTSLADLRNIPPELLHYAQICDATSPRKSLTRLSAEEMIHTAREARLHAGEGEIDLRGIFRSLPESMVISVEVPHAQRLPTRGQTAWAEEALAAAKACLEGEDSNTASLTE